MQLVDNDRAVGLGGMKQRATLGFLLLQANKVVATSQLLNALWGVDGAPTTARKILQNAVHGLRGVLSSTETAHGPVPGAPAALLTQPPGYMMRVDPEQVDLYLFHQWAGQGREQLARGSADAASVLLSDALALWRGPVLADLVEAGIRWPELAAVQSARLDVMEDYFDAQLACGRHHAVLPELEEMVRADPLRERCCGQLVLALYRCGRQADALNAYSSVRAALVESLGLEPGRGLQRLQQAILVQDPALFLVETETYAPLTAPAHPAPVLVKPAGDAPPEPPRAAATAAAAAGPEQRAVSDRRRVGVVSVRTRLAPSLTGGPGQEFDGMPDSTAQPVREHVERFGGTVTATTGPVSLALFGLEGPSTDDAGRAVLAALAIRDALHVRTGSGPGTAQPSVQAAVTTGEVLLCRRSKEGLPTVTGAVLDESRTLLADVPAGEVRVSDAVRRASEDIVLYRCPDAQSATWQALGVREAGRAAEDTERGVYELDVLRGLVKRTRHRGVPHLVTVLGQRGTGKSRLLRDFGRWAGGRPGEQRVLTGRVSPAGAGTPLAAPTQILAAYCGIGPGADEATARAMLARTVQKLFPSERTSEPLLSRLCRLLVVDTVGSRLAGEPSLARALGAWAQFFQEAAKHEPLVMCVDDLHHADDLVLDTFEEIAEASAPGALFVVAAAGPELLSRRPTWAGGKSHVTTVTLDRPGRATREQLVEPGRAQDIRRRRSGQITGHGTGTGTGTGTGEVVVGGGRGRIGQAIRKSSGELAPAHGGDDTTRFREG
ncbi:BTAD domain-containing putative transcriptional regulator [Streptomyces anulatus]